MYLRDDYREYWRLYRQYARKNPPYGWNQMEAWTRRPDGRTETRRIAAHCAAAVSWRARHLQSDCVKRYRHERSQLTLNRNAYTLKEREFQARDYMRLNRPDIARLYHPPTVKRMIRESTAQTVSYWAD